MPEKKGHSPNSIKYSIWNTRTEGSPANLKNAIESNKRLKSKFKENQD